MLQTQLSLLRSEASFRRYQDKIRRLASDLEGLANIPMVNAKLQLIQELQIDDYWTDITVEILEEVRCGLRDLVQLIEPRERKIVYTNFEDEIGEQSDVVLAGVGQGVDTGLFKMKVRSFLDQHTNHIVIQKLKRAEQLTKSDLDELERMFVDEAVSDREKLDEIQISGGLGVFLRSITGLDRPAAKAAFSEVAGAGLNSSQLEFVNLIIDYLCETGTVGPARFYEPPFTDLNSQGISGLFDAEQAKRIISIVRDIDKTAAA